MELHVVENALATFITLTIQLADDVVVAVHGISVGLHARRRRSSVVTRGLSPRLLGTGSFAFERRAIQARPLILDRHEVQKLVPLDNQLGAYAIELIHIIDQVQLFVYFDIGAVSLWRCLASFAEGLGLLENLLVRFGQVRAIECVELHLLALLLVLAYLLAEHHGQVYTCYILHLALQHVAVLLDDHLW